MKVFEYKNISFFYYKMDKYHYEILKKVANIYNINYDDIIKKIPYKNSKNNLPEYSIFYEEYKLKSLKDLQQVAIDNNCSKSGKKDVIIKRIYDILFKKNNNDDDNISIIEHIINNTIEKKDICVGTDNVNQDLKIPHTPIETPPDIVSNNKVTNKCVDISDKDLLLLLQTHNLSITGTRNDLVNRLKDFYKNNEIKNKNKNIEDYILELENDEYVSRHELNDNLMSIIEKGIKITLCENMWKLIDNGLNYNNYILIPNKNWIFKETDISYEFIGIANNDNTYNKCDIPEELLMISS
jgi:hypothetical protein